MKKLWALRHVFGMLLVFGLGIALLAAAVMRYPMYVGIAVLLFISWIIAIQPRVRKERERTKSLGRCRIPGCLRPPPESPVHEDFIFVWLPGV